MKRSSSMPLVAGGGTNPFWSQRVQADHLLEQVRPRILPPVPHDDDLGRDGSRETMSSGGDRPVKDLSGTPGSRRNTCDETNPGGDQ